MFLHCSKNKPRKMNVTHFQKYFASRWEIFCHSFMGMTAIRTKTTSAIRCNGMSKKMKKCWLPNRYSVELCLEGTFFFRLATLRCMFWSVRFHMQDEIRVCMRKAKFFSPFVYQTIENIQHPSKKVLNINLWYIENFKFLLNLVWSSGAMCKKLAP